jgi:hypothetical protein
MNVMENQEGRILVLTTDYKPMLQITVKFVNEVTNIEKTAN